MPPHAEGGGDAAGDGHAHEAAPLGLAVGIPELAAIAVAVFPAHQAQLLLALIEAGILELADLYLAGGGAGVIGDDVEPIVGVDAADRGARGDRLDVRLDQLGGGAGGARRAVQAGADETPDAQGRVIDRDRAAFHGYRLALAMEREVEIEAGAEGELFQRTCGAAVVAAAEREIEHRAGFEIGQRDLACDQIGGARGIGAADAGALERGAEAVAAAQGGGEFDDRALGRLGERADEIVGGHAAPGRCAEAERGDRERARFLALGAGYAGGDEAGDRLDARRGQCGGGDQAGAGGETAPPSEAADARAEIGHPVGLVQRGAKAILPGDDGHRRHGAAKAARTGAAGQFQSRLLAQEHGERSAPKRINVADHPRRRSERCGGKVLKSN